MTRLVADSLLLGALIGSDGVACIAIEPPEGPHPDSHAPLRPGWTGTTGLLDLHPTRQCRWQATNILCCTQNYLALHDTPTFVSSLPSRRFYNFVLIAFLSNAYLTLQHLLYLLIFRPIEPFPVLEAHYGETIGDLGPWQPSILS
jgi:hypothetical protein